MAKPLLAMNLDASEVHAVAGFLSQMSTSIKTDRHLSSVLNYTHSILSEEFNVYVDTVAQAVPNKLHHVYEWNMIGVPGARLWKNVLRGNSSNKIATFEWRASKKTVPVPDIPPGPGGQQLKQIHVFVWKAPIMEYNMRVSISPKRGEWLAFPTGDENNPLFFTKKTINVTNPGGQQTTGAFTGTFAQWWGGAPANQLFNDNIKRTLEKNLARTNLESVARKFRKPKLKTFAINTANSQEAFSFGKAAAEKFMSELTNKYIHAAMARERLNG